MSFSAYPLDHHELLGNFWLQNQVWDRDPAHYWKNLEEQAHQHTKGQATQARQQSSLSLLEQATVQIAAFDGNILRPDPPGSGVFIDSVHILTNAHVVGKSGGCQTTGGRPAERFFILTTQERGKPAVPKFTAILVQEDPQQRDLAVLRIEKELDEPNITTLNDLKTALASGRTLRLINLRTPRQALTFGDFEEFKSRPGLQETFIKVAGYPCVLEEGNFFQCKTPQPFLPQIQVVTGRVAGFRGDTPETQLLRLEVSASYGNSGGAVVDETTHKLIGILCGGEPTVVGRGFALARPIHQAELLAVLAGVRIPPVARFRHEPVAPRVQEPVIFDASDSKPRNPGGKIVEYSWDFDGDGLADAQGQKAIQTFTTIGLHRVTLTVVEELEGIRLEGSLQRTLPISCKEGQPGKIQIDSQQFATIQAAIDAVGQTIPDGAIITLGPGTYCESVVIRGHQLSLVGAGREMTFLLGNGQQPAISIVDSPEVTIEGVTISGGHIGIEVTRSKAMITDTTLRENLVAGIRFSRSTGEIRNNVVKNNQLGQGSLGRGVDLDGSEKVRLVENTISENAEAGLLLDFNSQADLEKNIISNNKSGGVIVTGKSQATLAEDRLEGNLKIGLLVTEESTVMQRNIQLISTHKDTAGDLGIGIVVEGNSKLTAVGTQISRSESSGMQLIDASAELNEKTIISQNQAHGIQTQGAGQLMVQNSEISNNNDIGLRAEGMSQIIVAGSTFSKNYVGIAVGDSAAVTIIAKSQISRNRMDGINIWGSAKLEIKDSVIKDNNPEHGDGIWVTDSGRTYVINVQTSGNANGIHVAKSAKLELKDSTIRDLYNGILIQDSGNAVITNTQLSNTIWVKNSAHAAVSNTQISVPKGWGIFIEDSSKLELVGSIITSTRYGIDIVGFSIATISNTQISNPFISVVIRNSAQVTISHTEISGSGADSIWLQDTAKLELKDSSVKNSSYAGIVMKDSTRARVSNAQISSNRQYGIIMTGTANATISNSDISRNGYGGVLILDSASVTLSNSQISYNSGNGIEIGYPVSIAPQNSSVTVQDSSIYNNAMCGIWAASKESWVFGSLNEMRGNGADLCGYVPPTLRRPLVSQTTRAALKVPSDYPTVQQAVDAIAPGGTITIGAGTYAEGLTLWKPLVLRGAGQEQTFFKPLLPDRRLVISIIHDAQGVVLEEMTVKESRTYDLVIYGQATLQNARVSDGAVGIELRGSAKVTISNVQVFNHWLNGIRAAGETNTTIQNSLIRNNAICGIWVLFKKDQIRGSSNEMLSNGADLCGFAPSSLRKPIVPQTTRLQISVPQDYKSLQEAVDAIAPGGTITVAAGTYETGLTVWKPLVLRGAGLEKTLIKAMPHYSMVISIIPEGYGVSLEGVTVTGSQYYGLFIYGQVTIRNAQISENGGDGISLGGTGSAMLTLAQIFKNKRYGIVPQDDSSVSISDSQVSYNGSSGIGMWGYAQAVIARTTISDNGGEGINMVAYSTVRLSDTQILRNRRAGVALQFANKLEVQNSAIKHNEGVGVYITETSNAMFSNCIISDNTYEGISILGTSEVMVRDTQISNNARGTWVGEFAKLEINESVINSNNNRGISVNDFSSAVISNTQIGAGNRVGISIEESASATISNAQITGNDQYGIAMNDFAKASITNNTRISNNGSDGILMAASSYATIINSTIATNGGNGIFLVESPQAQIQGNKILDNKKWGISTFLKKCGYPFDSFTGALVPSTGESLIQANEIKGNKEGQVCVPWEAFQPKGKAGLKPEPPRPRP